MSQETVVRMGLLSLTDAPAVSTILEAMFQYFDYDLRCHPKYKTIKKHVRLRLASIVFGESGYARLDMTVKPSGMVVPTAKLLSLFGLRKLTTDLPPLVLLPISNGTFQLETSTHPQYVKAFRSAMANKFPKFLEIPLRILQMEEQGVLRQSRASNGDLVCLLSKKGQEIFRQQKALEARTLAQRRLAIKKGLELEFEISSEDILLIREDHLPLPSELLEALQISQMELIALFDTATKLLAETDPNKRMRAYATQDSSGEWQVKLLSA